MHLAIDLRECLFRDLTTILLPPCLLLRPVPLQDTEYDDIKALVYVGGVCGIAEDMNSLSAGIVKKLKRVVGVVTVNNQ